MEGHDLAPMTILKLKKIHHCQKCYTTLKKKLLEVNGVHGVSVDQEKRLVSVRGKVEPWQLIKAVEELGNTAELLSYEKEPKKKSHSESTESDSIQKKGREKKSHIFPKSKESKKDEEEHMSEEYEPLTIDPEICRDPHCKQHKRRPIITSSVPSRDNENHPHHTSVGFFPGANQLFHQTNPLQYYNYPPELAAPPAYGGPYSGMPVPPAYGGSYSGMPVPHGFTFYGNGNPRECTTM